MSIHRVGLTNREPNSSISTSNILSMTNRLSSISLTIVLLFGIGLCFKSFDFLLINEVKALISVLFGFATSCLILSFIWLVQRKPIPRSLSQDDTSIVDMPVMHPHGRVVSSNSAGHRRRSAISTISSLLDEPPKYQDALVNSKPVNMSYGHYLEKIAANENQNNSTEYIGGHLLTDKYKSVTSCGQQQNNVDRAANNLVNLNAGSPNSSASTETIAQLALSIVKGFTTLEPISHQQVNRDVSKLIVSEAPPKYCDIHLESSNIDESTDNDTEPRSSLRPRTAISIDTDENNRQISTGFEMSQRLHIRTGYVYVTRNYFPCIQEPDFD